MQRATSVNTRAASGTQTWKETYSVANRNIDKPILACLKKSDWGIDGSLLANEPATTVNVDKDWREL